MASHGVDTALKHLRAIQDQSHLIQESWAELGRNILLVVIIAVTVWLYCGTLLWLVNSSTEHLFTLPWLLFGVLILGAIVRDGLLRRPSWKDAEGDGVASSLVYFYQSYQDQVNKVKDQNQKRYQQPTFLCALRRVVLTFLTIGTGGSGGLEGPVIPIGESVGSGWSAKFKIISPDDLRAFQMAGIAAAFATLLNAPLMAAVFAAEFVFTDRIIYRTLFYSLIAALIAYYLNNHFLHIQPLFSFHHRARMYTPMEYFYVTLVAILISAPAGLGVRLVFSKLKQWIQPVPVYYRATIGAILTAAIALILWLTLNIAPEHVLGMGEGTLKAVYEGTGNGQLEIWWVLAILVLAKTLTTGLTLMAGGSAGLLIPAMFMGGISGAAVYYGLGALGLTFGITSPDIFIVSGVASSLVAVIETPIAAIVFVFEAFGAAFGPPAIAAVVTCHLIAKRLRLYVRN